MKIQKNFWLGIAGVMLTLSAANAQEVGAEKDKAVPVTEEDEAILFKVHDITPVRAMRGEEISSCDFYVTFYNRSPKDINGADIELNWTDNSLSSVINAEKAVSAERKAKGENVDANFSYTQQQNPSQLMASVKMPAIKSYKQVTVKQNIKTDRCYALLDNLAIKVNSCSVKASSDSSSLSATDGCNGLFQFVSQDNPEYYTEFQKVSYASKKEAEIKKRASQEKEVEEQYQQTVKNMDLLSQTLAEIK